MRYKALIVDDSKPITFFNKVILERSSQFSEIVIAINGEDAINVLNTGFDPDIIFLDLNMPVMNGWEFLEYHNLQSVRNSQIIMLLGTALSQENIDKLNAYDFVKGIRAKMLSNVTLTEITNNILEAELRS